ncbi:MAG: hypothetical protein AB199_02335 [Parcubacteria bacterium C7867-004]|nr:MAG: hypothetical protein AB199_02335 [Parcubacteria bacterium C7867-004]
MRSLNIHPKLLPTLIVLLAVFVGVGIYFYTNPETFKERLADSLSTDTGLPFDIDLAKDSLTDEESQAMWEARNKLADSLEGYPIEANFLPDPVLVPHPQGQDYLTLYKIGTITNGELKGETLYLESEDGMGGAYYSRAIVRDGNVITLRENQFTFPYEYDFPEIISIPGTQHTLKKGSTGWFLFDEKTKLQSVFTDPQAQTLYRADYGQCLIAEMPDHIGVSYDLDIPFVTEESGKLSVRLPSGSFFEDEYDFFNFGCGAGCRLLRYVDPVELDLPARLAQVATDPKTNEAVYGIASSEDRRLKELYADENTLAYFREDDNWEHTPTNKYTYQEFLSHKPLLYWKDPWGKWIEFQNKRFATAAEKCKPVIYLYPRTPGTFHVEVAPNGGFTKTIPEYGDGWDVFAQPSGLITDIASGLTYPYLYWSGIGINYPEITEGWIVPKEGVDSFLSEKLYALGLEGKEIADFKEYWVPRLSEKPYYKISFMAPRTFEQLAPLSVAPIAPDTKIRVMMTAQATDGTESLPVQHLPQRPVRNGFVLVEWGGAVLY